MYIKLKVYKVFKYKVHISTKMEGMQSISFHFMNFKNLINRLPSRYDFEVYQTRGQSVGDGKNIIGEIFDE